MTTDTLIEILKGKYASVPPVLVTQENAAGEVVYVGIKGSGAGMTGVPLRVFASALNRKLIAFNLFSGAYEVTCKGAGMDDAGELYYAGEIGVEEYADRVIEETGHLA